MQHRAPIILLFFLGPLAAGCAGAAPPPAAVEIPSARTPPPSSAAAPRTDAPRPVATQIVPVTVPTRVVDDSPVPRDPQRAEALFVEGRQAAMQGDLATARDRFEQSYRFDPAAGTLLNLADVEQKLGDRASALRHFDEAYHLSLAQGRADRAHVAKARADALRGP